MGEFTEKAGAEGAARQWWSVAAMLCAVAGGALLLLGHQDWAFAAAVLGVVAWFMNVRAQLHRANVGRDEERARDEDEGVEDEGADDDGEEKVGRY